MHVPRLYSKLMCQQWENEPGAQVSSLIIASVVLHVLCSFFTCVKGKFIDFTQMSCLNHSGEQHADGGSGPSCVRLSDEAGPTRRSHERRGGEESLLKCQNHVKNEPRIHFKKPDFTVLSFLVQVDCLVLQLHRIGEQLEKVNSQRMDELFFLLRDGFLLQEGLSSMARLLLLEILEFRAGGWLLSSTAHKYYYSEIAD